MPTPLCWTLWNHPLERAMRGAFCDIGCLPPSAVRVAERVDDRYSGIFFGRFTANIDQMRAMGDLMPGTSADTIEEQILGGVASGATSSPTMRRYPVVALKMPRQVWRIPGVLAQRRREIDAWWRATVTPGAIPDGRAALSRSWREDPSPLEALLSTYKTMDDSAAPAAVEAQRVAERQTASAELLSRLPALRRPGAKILLAAARRHIPLREVGKAAFLQALDGARAAARVAGEELAGDGSIGHPDDVCYLTVEEIIGTMPADPKAVVAFRRAKREEYLELRLLDTWTGVATPTKVEAAAAAQTGEQITGLAVSPRVAEGRARVVLNPAVSDLEPGEVLVCETTDPSWASLFLVASALVIDIGGALSHGAIVARELGVPCVINTRVGTRRLRTGDLLRVDGDTGVVIVLDSTS